MPTLTRENVTLHYELEGSGPPVVYICGFASHSNDVLATLIRQTLSQTYTVLSADNRGAGQTIVGENAPTSFGDMADDIAFIMEHHGMESAHVLGISMGGCIAMLLALRHPSKVKSLVLAVSLAWSPEPSRGRFMLETSRLMRDQGVPREFINRQSAITLLSEELFQYEPFLEAWVNAPRDPYEQSRTGYEQQIAGLTGYDIRDQLPTINVPTLVMSSPDDMLVPPRFQDEIANGIPNAEIKRYVGGHIFMLIPMYSAQFYQDILEFWRKQG